MKLSGDSITCHRDGAGTTQCQTGAEKIKNQTRGNRPEDVNKKGAASYAAPIEPQEEQSGFAAETTFLAFEHHGKDDDGALDNLLVVAGDVHQVFAIAMGGDEVFDDDV